MTLNSIFVCALAFVLPVSLLTGCDRIGGDTEMSRSVRAEMNFRAKKDVVVTLVWKKSDTPFLAGATLAAEEINAAGGIAGHRMRLDLVDETPYVENRHTERSLSEGRYRDAYQEAGRKIAQAALADPDSMVVIGHTNVAAAKAAMMSYDDSEVLFISPGITATIGSWSRKQLYFQLAPQMKDIAAAMCKTMQSRRWDRVYFVYEATQEYEQFVELIKTELPKLSIQIAGSIAVMPGFQEGDQGALRLQSALKEIQDPSVDAVVLISGPKFGSMVVNYARRKTILSPFIGLPSLSSGEFRDRVGEAGLGTRIVSVRDHGYQFEKFAGRMNARFPNLLVEETAAAAYDSVWLYAHAVASAKSTDPRLVSHTLHYGLPVWYGLLGPYHFKDGFVTGLKVYPKKLVLDKTGKSRFVPDTSSY